MLPSNKLPMPCLITEYSSSSLNTPSKSNTGFLGTSTNTFFYYDLEGYQYMRIPLPTPNPSQEGNLLIGMGQEFPSWEGLGVGSNVRFQEIFQITFQVVFYNP